MLDSRNELRMECFAGFDFNGGKCSPFRYYQIDLIAFCVTIEVQIRAVALIQYVFDNFQNEKVLIQGATKWVPCHLIRRF